MNCTESAGSLKKKPRELKKKKRVALLRTPPPLIVDVVSIPPEEPSTSMVGGPESQELVSTLEIKYQVLSPLSTTESFKSFEEITAGLIA